MELEFQPASAWEHQALHSMKISPRLVAASQILELTSRELQQKIAAELLDNPALELVDLPSCRVCGMELHGSRCPRCIHQDAPASTQLNASGDDTNEVFDPLTHVASEETLAEKLMSDMGAVLPARDMPIVEYLIGSLDDKGYLAVRTEDVAYELGIDHDHVRTVLGVLQSMDPVGVGARNLRECLLIQLDHLQESGLSQPLAREIVSQFLVELGEHKFTRIARELDVALEAVMCAWEFVKRKLNPHPAHGFSPTNTRDRDTRSMYITPDVTISRRTDDYEIDVVESRRFALRVSPMYARLVVDDQRQAGAGLSSEERVHVQQYAGRARMFIANITQRRHTMLKITTCIVDRQREYLEHGVRSLLPLNRANIAEQLGLHESTVSRATAGKYAMLPNGEVIPFSYFFTPNLSVKDILKEVVEKEGKPLTDNDIRELLKLQGIHIARRTVAKYRTALAILPSLLR